MTTRNTRPVQGAESVTYSSGVGSSVVVGAGIEVSSVVVVPTGPMVGDAAVVAVGAGAAVVRTGADLTVREVVVTGDGGSVGGGSSASGGRIGIGVHSMAVVDVVVLGLSAAGSTAVLDVVSGARSI